MTPISLRHLLAAMALAATAGPVLAHARLQAAEPASGAGVASPPALRLHFNEAVEPAMSTVKVTGPGAAVVELGKPAAADGDPKTLVSTVPKPLPAGEYRLEWSTMGHDGHHTKGEFRFTVK